jgi:hypothetical protein
LELACTIVFLGGALGALNYSLVKCIVVLNSLPKSIGYAYLPFFFPNAYALRAFPPI